MSATSSTIYARRLGSSRRSDPDLGFPCQEKNCEEPATSMIEIKLDNLKLLVWGCGEHAGDLEDQYGATE